MVKYSCETCHKTFSQKGHFEKHMNRKRPCKKDNTLDILIEQKIQELSFRPNIDNKKLTLVNIGEYKDLSPKQEISLHSFLIFMVLFLIAIFYYNWHIKSRQYINHQHLIEELKKINEISSSNFDNKTTNQ